MRILFLDDEKYRHDAFTEATTGAEVWHAWNVDQAIEHLSLRPFDLVCLDHDLGSLRKEENGSAVASYVAQMVDGKRPARVLLHTFNRDGAVRMADHLRRTDTWHRWMPFGPTFLESVKALVEASHE